MKLNNIYKIETPYGWSDFKGVQIISNKQTIRLNFESGNYIQCTPDHMIRCNNEYIEAKDIIIGGYIDGKNIKEKVIEIINISFNKDVYDIVGIENKESCLYANNIITHNCDFIGSINTIVDKEVLEKLYFGVQEPITREMTDKLLIYEKPVDGSRYVIGADTAKGTGEHYSALQVCKIISTNPSEFQQVATFFDNRINVFKFADLINKLSIYYNNAFMMVENNAEGSAVVNRLWWDYENEGLVNTGSKESQLGIRATKNTRPRAVTLMKKMVEDEKVHIVDKETVDELTSFIEENGKFKGKDMPDDIISALYWCLFIVEMDVFDEKATLARDTHEAEEGEEVWGIITDGDPENNFDWLISESKLID